MEEHSSLDYIDMQHGAVPNMAENTNMEENFKIYLPVKFRWIPFSDFRGEVENVSANQKPGLPSCLSDLPEKHKLGRGRWDLAPRQVSLNSVQRFQSRSRKFEKHTTDGRTMDKCTIFKTRLLLTCFKDYNATW